jgi:hypothetical protein
VIERKYLDMFDRLKREDAAGPTRAPMEPLPGWLARRRQDRPAAADVLARIPSGAVIPGRDSEGDLSQSA